MTTWLLHGYSVHLLIHPLTTFTSHRSAGWSHSNLLIGLSCFIQRTPWLYRRPSCAAMVRSTVRKQREKSENWFNESWRARSFVYVHLWKDKEIIAVSRIQRTARKKKKKICKRCSEFAHSKSLTGCKWIMNTCSSHFYTRSIPGGSLSSVVGKVPCFC